MTATVFTDPFSGRETLLVEPLEGSRVGSSYDPRRSDMPTAWHVGCHHCQQLRWRGDLTIHEKKEIQIARGREAKYLPELGTISHTYSVPTHCYPHSVTVWSDRDNTKRATILGSDPLEILKVTKLENGSLEYEGNLRRFRSIQTNLRRYLRFILSAREIGGEELSAILLPLVNGQRARKTYRGYHKTCDLIDWISILNSETKSANNKGG